MISQATFESEWVTIGGMHRAFVSCLCGFPIPAHKALLDDVSTRLRANKQHLLFNGGNRIVALYNNEEEGLAHVHLGGWIEPGWVSEKGPFETTCGIQYCVYWHPVPKPTSDEIAYSSFNAMRWIYEHLRDDPHNEVTLP